VAWLDDDREVVRSQFEVPGLGKVLLYRTSKDVALAPVSGGSGLDVGISQYVRLARALPRPHQTTEVRYRITVKDEDDVAGIFSEDSRQEVKIVAGNRLELRVRGGSAGEPAEAPGVEFSESSYFINSADARVQDLTRKAVGTERDPWKKALRIERWVHQSMRVRSHEALATADHVARTLEGDCTEFAMLTAAMCRAAGIPSRTAVGLIYADTRSGPVFAFHMWTEAWADGAWRPLDATLGLGRVGAAHLKIANQSWHEERSLTPLLPVVRVLGKLSIEVVEVRH
jgi:transglutaminase-like putative cysteine protease